MLRINVNMLAIKNGKYCYQENFFTGIAFVVSDGFVESAKEYKAGELIGDYFNKYFDSQLKIDSDYLEPENEDDYEPFLCYKGKLFSGIAYDFENNGSCTGEYLYLDGWSDSSVGYYKSGKLEAVELVDDNFSQQKYWYENGQIKRFEILERNSFNISLAYEETGEITVLSIEGLYFEKIEQRVNNGDFNNKNFIRDLKAANQLFISGSAIDDEIFNNLISKDGLEVTCKLSIHKTSLTIASLNKLIACKTVKHLTIASDILCLDDLKAFKFQRANCYVEFDRDSNREEVTIY